jgi:Gpi18-like mannosyltransferase
MKTLGTVFQVLSVASIVAAAIVFLWKLVRPLPVQELSEEKGWFKPKNLRALGWAVFAAIGSRIALAGLAYAGLAAANAWGSADLQNQLAQYGFNVPLPPLSSLLTRWDAPHYLDIARLGYTADRSLGDQWLFIVFYPLYPALTALLKPVFGTEFNAATIISWLSLAGACYWMYRLSLLDNDKPEARRAVKFLLIFPAAVFLGAPYTESLFLLLTVLCLYALRKRSFWLAGVFGFLAALTRNLGAVLVVPFAVEVLDAAGLFQDWRKFGTGKFWLDVLKHGVWALLIPLAIGVYLLINQVVYGNPLMFLQIQRQHWSQSFQPFWQTVATTWGNLVGYSRTPAEKAFLWMPQTIGMLAVFVSLPFMARKLRPSYTAYLVVYTVASLSASWLLSFNRYMMGAVPLFLGIAALTKGKLANWVLTIVFVAVMLFLAVGFFMWQSVY